MSQIIEVNIADILLRLENKIDKLSEEIKETRLELNSKIDKLDGKVSGLDKRVENLEFIARTVGGGVVVALLLGLAKFLFPTFTL
jgi:predicted nuclease with TOPRIM domain